MMTVRHRIFHGSALTILAIPACAIPTQLDRSPESMEYGDDKPSGNGSGDGSEDGAKDGSEEDSEGTADIAVEDIATRIAAARCSSDANCCSGIFLGEPSFESCEASVIDYYTTEIEDAQNLGLEHDPDCIAAMLAFYSTSNCEPSDGSVAGLDCALFRGTAGLGEPCTGSPLRSFTTIDECTPGLICLDGTCRTKPGELGDPCLNHDCASALYCDPDTEQCTAPAQVGEACDDEHRCSSDGWCAGRVCEPKRIAGESCSYQEQCVGACADSGTCVDLAAVCLFGFEATNTCELGTFAIEEFVADNQTCESDDDCVAESALCLPGAACGLISLSVAHDGDRWEQLANGTQAACGDCGADPCGAVAICDAGTCRIAIEI